MAKLTKQTILTLHAKVPRGENGIWQAIRALDARGQPWTLADIDGELNMDRKVIAHYVRRLRRGGYITERARVTVRGKVTAPAYRLTAKGNGTRSTAPRLRWDGKAAPPISAELMWRAMRNLSSFSIDDIAFIGSTDTHRIDKGAATVYVEALATAGYLVLLGETNGRKQYRLKASMNSGPRYPVKVAVAALFDPNRSEYVGVAEPVEALP
ncbi:MAG: hypothetical protein AB7U62_19485 [Pseudolabrys sp.]